MRRLFKLLSSRLFWMFPLFATQTAFIVYLVLWASFTEGALFFFTGLSVVLGIIVMSRNERAPYKMVWLFLLVIFPLFGGVFYLLFGDKKIGKLSQKKLAAFWKKLPDSSSYISTVEDGYNKLPEKYKRTSTFIRNTTNLPAWSNTECEYFAYGEDFFVDVLKELEKAKKFIFIEYFIIAEGKWWGRMLEVLKRKVKEGVDVRVLYDDMGTISALPASYSWTLRSYGIKCCCFNRIKMRINPRLNFRDHRKILSIDGNICYTGGLNLADEYANDELRFGYWKDSAIKLKGAAVWNLTFLFLRMWGCLTNDDDDLSLYIPTISVEGSGAVQPFGDNPFDDAIVTENTYLELLNNARRYVWITTPYLIPDEAISDTLKRAAKAGIDVRIITPHYPDKKSVFEVTRSNYQSLLEAGVKIYEFTPGFIHSKCFIVDDEVFCIGTTNIDYRSLYLHFELSVMLYGCAVIEDIKEDYEKTLMLSKQQTLEDVKKIGFYTWAKRFVFKLFSPAL